MINDMDPHAAELQADSIQKFNLYNLKIRNNLSGNINGIA